ncbi:MAG: GGDEF domain-containing protein [Rhodocyclaceae bacterium]|nr:GGDEF domain-containing protein [Rhodocyclaceae bacterium]MDZ4214149.1 GGDEF domain-containing protein [Rhodocyclaceae bacterium]
MKIALAKRLETRLIVAVGLGLLVFSFVAGLFTFNYSYQQQLEQSAAQQRQLVKTVQAQAEVALFAANAEIANGVLQGLLANPVILAARIEAVAGANGFVAELGSRSEVDFSRAALYPLYSPVNHIELIGSLRVVQNTAEVNGAAARSALYQTSLMLVQVLAAVLIMVVMLRIRFINPIIQMAEALNTIQPGSSMRLPVAVKHADDEIGLLTQGANTLLTAAENAIDEVKAQRNELERLATHDHLTGLPTLRLAADRLRIACGLARRAQRKVALLFIDLDAFKPVNDSFGHDVGDEVLCEVARRLGGSIRAEDTVARIGGDEFIAIVSNLADADAVKSVAASIRDAVAQPITVTGHAIHIGASIGIALFPDDAEDLEGLRRAADQAMYQAKKSGKGRFAFANAAAGTS